MGSLCILIDGRAFAEDRLVNDGKTGPRMVPLTTPVLKVLDGIERVESNPWIIRSRKPGAFLPDLTYHWNRIQARAGLEGNRIHDLRHSCASPRELPTPRNLLTHCNNAVFPAFSQAA